MAMLFITHDLALLPYVADDVAVLHAGALVDQLSVSAFLAAPTHPFSRALLSQAQHWGPT